MMRPSCVNKMFAMRACRGSIMIGTPLNGQEMKKVSYNHVTPPIVTNVLLVARSHERNESTLGKLFITVKTNIHLS